MLCPVPLQKYRKKSNNKLTESKKTLKKMLFYGCFYTFRPKPYSSVCCNIGMSSMRRKVALAPDIFELIVAKRFAKSGLLCTFKPDINLAE